MKIYSEDFFYKNLLGFNSREVIEDIVVTANVYQNFTIKVNGKNRDISAINSNTKLYHLQRKLLKNFLNNIPLPNCVCGFVEGKSYLDFLKPHCGKKYYIRLDIKNFFNSIKSINIAKVLDEYIQLENQEQKQQVIKDICKIVTLNDSLPQGAVTSPQLSNIFFRRLDIRIRNYCRKFKVEYTRYADDMLFSSMEESLHQDFFVNKISKIVKDINLNINKKKVIKSKNKIILNGYVISDKISLSRNKMKKINTFIYSFI
ncbi:reverse transcriptase family protein [Lysinibacillus sp. NPDC095746]|uniref:reverse transcriptase family protein n=1 Tax=Lysinibacillus sp. NPDC095746 TaxID=3364134 RepID=UPI003807331F